MSNFYERKVRRLLTDLYCVVERQYMRGDFGATEELVDLERAIEQAELTNKQAEAIRLVFFDDIEQAEAGLRMGIDQSNVSRYISAAIKKIAKYYEGRLDTKQRGTE